MQLRRQTPYGQNGPQPISIESCIAWQNVDPNFTPWKHVILLEADQFYLAKAREKLDADYKAAVEKAKRKGAK